MKKRLTFEDVVLWHRSGRTPEPVPTGTTEPTEASRGVSTTIDKPTPQPTPQKPTAIQPQPHGAYKSSSLELMKDALERNLQAQARGEHAYPLAPDFVIRNMLREEKWPSEKTLQPYRKTLARCGITEENYEEAREYFWNCS